MSINLLLFFPFRALKQLLLTCHRASFYGFIDLITVSAAVSGSAHGLTPSAISNVVERLGVVVGRPGFLLGLCC